MPTKTPYKERFDGFAGRTLLEHLQPEGQAFVRKISESYLLSYQDVRKLSEACRDVDMWQEESVESWWQKQEAALSEGWPVQRKKKFLLDNLNIWLAGLKGEKKRYPREKMAAPNRGPLQIIKKDSEKKIFGDCPVASPKTVCCNLKTIDAVENCGFGCSYCTIETFYDHEVAFDSKFAEKLEKTELDPNRFYHFGTGQSSDSLMWGNREGILDAACAFARKWPNILLEFKTKSANVTYFLENEVPRNIVCSWSLNTETIVNNEEHFTASLEQRLTAARKVADLGIKVAFHFHPIVYYQGWKGEYTSLAKRVLDSFSPNEVLFVSYGSVTFIKPILKDIRIRGEKTKITQMELVADPHGKLTYPDPIKLELFRAMVGTFQPWKEEVFQYLCMERAFFWDEVFGWHYPTNDEFEHDFGKKTLPKTAK